MREVLAIGNIPKRSPLEWRSNDHLVNMYIRIRVETDVSNKWYRKIWPFRIERGTSEIVVREVLAIENIPKRSPLEWRGNDHLVNMYIRVSRGDRRLEQMVQKNLAVLVIAKKVGNTSRETTFCALLVLVSEPIVFHIGRSYPWALGYPT